jgi:phosphatidate cytidylyltransferase
VLRTRLKTAAILLPTVIAIVLFAPPAAFTLFIAIVTAWGLHESGAMVKATTGQWAGVAVIGGFAPWLLVRGATVSWLIPFGVIVAAAAVLIVVGSRGPEDGRRIPGWSWSSALWVAVLFPYFALLRNGKNGIAVLILMVLLVVASDSGAYFAGRSLGRSKLLPRVSPNKTVEGAIGGLVAGVAVGLLLRRALTPDLGPGRITVLALIGGGLAQIGDLVNSAFKRIAGVKDSGWIFPGHGGLLDRTCSLVFPVTFAYYYLRQ